MYQFDPTGFRESRLLHYLPSTFRNFSSGTVKDQANALQVQSRASTRKQESASQASRNTQRSERAAVEQFNDRAEASGSENYAARRPAGTNVPGNPGSASMTVQQYKLPSQDDITELESRAREEYTRSGSVSRQTEAALERAASAYSNADKRAKTRASARSEIIDAAKADQRRRMEQGESIDPWAEDAALSSRLAAQEAVFQTDDQKDSLARQERLARRGGAPSAPQTRSERLKLRAPTAPGSSGAPSSIYTPGVRDGASRSPSQATTSMVPPSSIAGIQQEEMNVADPVLSALDQSERMAENVYGQIGGLLEQRGLARDLFHENASLVNEQTKRDKIRIAGQQMDYEMDLEEESLARERRDAELAQEEEDRAYNRLYGEQVKENAERIQRGNTQLGARYGGFGSGAGLQLIEKARMEGTQILREITEDQVSASQFHRNKLLDIEANHRLSVKDIMVRHDATVTSALDDALTTALEIDEDALMADEEKIDATIALVQQTADKLDSIRSERGTELSNVNRNTLTRRDQLHSEGITKQKEGLDLLKWHLNTYGNTNPVGMKGIIDQLEDLGVDTRGLNGGAPTLEQVNSLQGSYNAERFKVGQYVMDGESLGDRVLMVTSNLPTSKMETARDIGFSYLEKGDLAGFQEWEEKTAFDSLDVASRNDVMKADNTIRSVDRSRQTLAQFETDDLGYYNSLLQSAQPLIGQQRDPRFIKIKSQIESDQARIRNEIFGAALSPQEAELATGFLVDFKVDTLSDIVTKLGQMEQLAKDVRETRYGYATGGFSGGQVSEPMTPADGDDFFRSLGDPFTQGGGYDPNGEQQVSEWVSKIGPVLQRFDTKIGYTVHGKNQHQGLDIDGKKGQPIPAFRGGRVVKVIPDPNPGVRKGWGNRVIIEDSEGYQHQYSHLQDIHVKEGDTVGSNHVIATMGNTGFVIPGPGGDGSHLDYEVLKDGAPVDPEQIFNYRTLAHAS